LRGALSRLPKGRMRHRRQVPVVPVYRRFVAMRLAA
jgi:hypothetical protein